MSSSGQILMTEKLDGSSNYSTWAFSLKMLLIHEGLWSYATNPKPEASKSDTDKANDERALAKICLLIKPHLYPYVQPCTTAKQAWDVLATTFGSTGLLSRLSVLRQLFRITLDGRTLDEYVAVILSLTQQLSTMGKPLDDEFIAVLLLNGLTDEFDPLVMAIENSATTLRTPHPLLGALNFLLIGYRLQGMELKNGRIRDARSFLNSFKTGNYKQSLFDESHLLFEILSQRNNIPNVQREQYFTKGIYYERSGMARENEVRVSNAWKSVFDLNKSDVHQHIITKHDDFLEAVLDKEMAQPMWHDLNMKNEMDKSKLSEFRLSSISYMVARFDSMLLEMTNEEMNRTNSKNNNHKSGDSGDKNFKQVGTPRLKVLENEGDPIYDKPILIKNDLNSSGFKEMTTSAYIRERMKQDLNPHFMVNPIDALNIILTFFKATNENNDAFSYGVRYLELAANRFTKYSGYPVYQVTISSEGELTSLHIYSHSCDKLRYILNQLMYLVTHKAIHRYEVEYLEVQREFLFAHLVDPHASIFLKKTLSPIFLYFGHRTDADDKNHNHPFYDIGDYAEIDQNARQFFRASRTCSGCMRDVGSRKVLDAVFSMVRKQLYDSIDTLRTNTIYNMPSTAAFVKGKLLKFKANYSIIHDLTFLMSSNNLSGYSRSNKLFDFESTINPMIKKNVEYLESTNNKTFMLQQALRLRMQMKGMTIKMLDQYAYPSGNSFRANISSNLTSRSAGIGPINISITVGDKSYRSSTTSKLGHVAAKGSQILDVSKALIKGVMPSEVMEKMSISAEEWDAMPEGRRIHLCGLYSIGTRAVAGGRPVRPIYMQPVHKHIMQAAFMGPVLKASLSLNSPNSGSYFSSIMGLGSGFSTKHNRYGIDSVALPVMASSSGKYLLLQADSSNWDQNLLQSLLAQMYMGLHEGLVTRKAYFEQTINNQQENVPYMFDGPRALTPIEISLLYAQAQGESMYVTRAYGGAIIFPVNYMESGKLDTFFSNTVQNLDIMEQVAAKLGNKELRALYVQAAGDDITTVFTMPQNPTKAELESIRTIVSNEYENHNHIMNVFKTVISPISGEYTKIHFYLGMLFREPSVQPMESENKDNAETFIERSRGFVQKMYEYGKRAPGDATVNASLFRMLSALSYFVDIPISKYSSRKRRWYLPYVGTIVPTGILGGLGASISGFKMNEITTFDDVFEDKMNDTLGLLNMVQFTNKDLISRQILSLVTQRKDAKGRKTNKDSISIEDPLNSGDNLSFINGYEYFPPWCLNSKEKL